MVPDTKEARESLRLRCREVAATLSRDVPPSKDELEAICRRLLTEENLAEGFLGWTMVVLSTEFWEDQIKSIPYDRRLFLLPHCLKHAEGCPADYDEFGLACKTCGACSIADFRGAAEELGYKVLVAEGSPIVLKIIVSGHVDAIVGVACLNVLEKAIDKIMLAGIPCMAVPLLSSDCRNTVSMRIGSSRWFACLTMPRRKRLAVTFTCYVNRRSCSTPTRWRGWSRQYDQQHQAMIR